VGGRKSFGLRVGRRNQEEQEELIKKWRGDVGMKFNGRFGGDMCLRL